MSNIACFGLGAMGYGIARSILRQGHTTYGFDVVPSQMERFQTEGGASAAVSEIAQSLDAVVVGGAERGTDRKCSLRYRWHRSAATSRRCGYSLCHRSA